MTDLIKRLKAAEAGSRELDALIWCEFNDAVFHRLTDQERALIYTPANGKGMKRESSYAPVATSLDAALALAERVLPGWRRHLNELPRSTGLGWEATVWTDAADLSARPSRAATPALALCIAILKATDTGRG